MMKNIVKLLQKVVCFNFTNDSQESFFTASMKIYWMLSARTKNTQTEDNL